MKKAQPGLMPDWAVASRIALLACEEEGCEDSFVALGLAVWGVRLEREDLLAVAISDIARQQHEVCLDERALV